MFLRRQEPSSCVVLWAPAYAGAQIVSGNERAADLGLLAGLGRSAVEAAAILAAIVGFGSLAAVALAALARLF